MAQNKERKTKAEVVPVPAEVEADDSPAPKPARAKKTPATAPAGVPRQRTVVLKESEVRRLRRAKEAVNQLDARAGRSLRVALALAGEASRAQGAAEEVLRGITQGYEEEFINVTESEDGRSLTITY